MSLLCVITARGGSKRLPGKNIRLLDGKPLISYAIVAAQESGICDEIVVTSDSEEIRSVAREWGALTDKEPAEVAGDTNTGWDAIQSFLERNQPDFDYLLQLVAVKPLLMGTHIREAYDLFIEQDADVLMSVEDLGWLSDLNFLSEDGVHLTMRNWKKYTEIERHAYTHINTITATPPWEYRINGVIGLFKMTAAYGGYFAHEKIIGYVSPPNGFGDIDTILDFQICEIRKQLQKEQ